MTSYWWNVAPSKKVKDFELLSYFLTQIIGVGIVLFE
jgi:hypothetical protein